MQSHALHHVSVWLDDHSSGEGAFPQAMEWAYRLGLPLRVVATSARFANHSSPEEAQGKGPNARDRQPAPVVRKIRDWGSACAQRGVTMETSFWQGEPEVGIEQFLRSWGLCVVEENRSDATLEKLLARSMRNPEVPLLVTPRTSMAMTRVLILYYPRNPSALFLETVARLCQALETQPLIVTVASTEREARLQQSFAEGVCGSLQLQADFDSVVAYDVCAAVNRIARWRNCSHLFVERPQSISLWQRWRGDTISELRGLSDSLSLLALPAAIALDVPYKIRPNRFDRARSYSRSIESKL